MPEWRHFLEFSKDCQGSAASKTTLWGKFWSTKIIVMTFSAHFLYSEHCLKFQCNNEHGGLCREPRVQFLLQEPEVLLMKWKQIMKLQQKFGVMRKKALNQFFHVITWSLFSVLWAGNGGWMPVEHRLEMVLHCLL